jgi:hypothetical protein
MTELELYKFINDNNVEWHKRDNEGTEDVVILPYIFLLEEFSKLIKDYDSDEGLILRLQKDYVGIWMKDLCEYFGIELNNVFKGQDYDE